MTASALQSMNLGSLAHLWWLPAGGQGNDLDDDAWVPVLELCQRDVPAEAVLLAVMAALAWHRDNGGDRS